MKRFDRSVGRLDKLGSYHDFLSAKIVLRTSMGSQRNGEVPRRLTSARSPLEPSLRRARRVNHHWVCPTCGLPLLFPLRCVGMLRCRRGMPNLNGLSPRFVTQFFPGEHRTENLVSRKLFAYHCYGLNVVSAPLRYLSPELDENYA